MIMKRNTKFALSTVGMTGIVLTSVFVLGASSSQAATGITNDFNTEAQVTDNLHSYVDSGVVAWGATGGLSDTGAINTDNNDVNAVFATKSSYSLGPVGSTYAFSSYINSLGSSGYSGVGFTSLVPSASADDDSVNGIFRPTDALGVSVHGGGFFFHNGATDFGGGWSDGGSPIIIDTAFTGGGDLIDDGWYKIELIITRASETTFDMKLSVWPCDSAGVLGNVDPTAVFELNDQTSPVLSAAPSIMSYINFSGHRVEHFDNFSVQLAGGASVIEPGAPVVLTSGATAAAGVITADGEVTAEGDDSVTERGFAYGTVSDPTIADSTIVVGAGIGTFTGTSSALTDGTYFVRAYATNSLGTSYGAAEEITIAAETTSDDTAAASAETETTLAKTGSSTSAIWLATLLALAGASWGTVMLTASRLRARRSN
jgi:hypothetical protein